MSFEQQRRFLSTRQTKVFAEYFPDEAISNRLINWLHLVLTWINGRLGVRVSLDVRTRPELLITELKFNHISPDKVKEIRLAKMYEKRHFDWFEESDIFYHTFIYSIHEQELQATKPVLLKSRRIEECIMLFDGIAGDRDTTDVFLFNAKQRWTEFKPVIEILRWVKKGDVEKNIDAITSSFESCGEFLPHVHEHYYIDDPYTRFMVWIYSIGIGKNSAKRISTQAKKAIRQSLPRKTKGKSQINVLISNLTISKLEMLCKFKNSSKAILITELIENYSTYNKEIDAAINKAKTGVLDIESPNPLQIFQLISPTTSRASDKNPDTPPDNAQRKSNEYISKCTKTTTL